MTIYVRASNAPVGWHDETPYRCLGSGDQTTILAAIAAAYNAGTGVELSAGLFRCSSQLRITQALSQLVGQSMGPEGPASALTTDLNFSVDSGVSLYGAGTNVANVRLSGYGQLVMVSNNHVISNVMAYRTGKSGSKFSSFLIPASGRTISGITFNSCVAYYPDRYGFAHNAMGGSLPSVVENVTYNSCKALGCGYYDRYGETGSGGYDWQNGFNINETVGGTVRNITYNDCIADYNWECGWYSEHNAILDNIVLNRCQANHNGQQYFQGVYTAEIGQGAGYLLQGLGTGCQLIDCSANHNSWRHVGLGTYAGSNILIRNFTGQGGAKYGINPGCWQTGAGVLTIDGTTTLADCEQPILFSSPTPAVSTPSGCVLRMEGPFAITGTSQPNAAIKLTHNATGSYVRNGSISGYAVGIYNTTGTGTPLPVQNVTVIGATTDFIACAVDNDEPLPPGTGRCTTGFIG